MAYYNREEQETILNYSPYDNYWRLYSTYPPDIKRILESDMRIIATVEDDDGRIIEVDARADKNQVRLFKPL